MMFIVWDTTYIGKRFNGDFLDRLQGEAEKQKQMVEDVLRIAEKVRKDTENAMTQNIQENIEKTVEAVEKSVEVSNKQDRMITGVAEQFDEMNRNVNELVCDISKIDNMIESLFTANNQIVDKYINA